MSQLINKTGFIEDDWQGEILPFDAFWNGQDLPEEEPFGVAIDVATDPFDLQPWFGRVDMIVIPFAGFADGRGFSLARKLRQLGYQGRIRAQGHLLVDQFRAAMRVGIDQLEISDDLAARMPEHQWKAVPLSDSYQSHLNAA